MTPLVDPPPCGTTVVVGGAGVVAVVVAVAVVVVVVDTVDVEPPVPVWTTSRGGLAVSRVSNAAARVEGSTRARSTTPPLAAAAVTSMSTHEPDVIGPELPTSAPGGGALVNVTVLSSHGAETLCTSIPEGRSLVAWRESVAFVTPVTEAGRTKRR